MTLETQTKLKVDPINLDILWQRLEAPQKASGPALIRMSKLVSTKRKKAALSFNKVLEAMPYYSSPACDHCAWKTRCPYYYRDGICVALSKLLDTPERRLDRFVVTGPLLFEEKVKKSVILTTQGDGYTLEVILLASLLLILLQKHTQFRDAANLRTVPVKTKQKDADNKGTIFPTQRSSVARAEKSREERAELLGTKSPQRRLSRERHERYTRFRFFDP